MGSRKTLLALAGVAALLSLWLAADLARGRGGERDRRLLPEASETAIVAISIARPGADPIELVRRDGALAMTAPIAATMSEPAAAELDATLLQLSHRRHVGGRVNAATRAEVRVTLASGVTIELDVGDEVASTGQAWMSRRGWPGSYLVDGHSARVLARGVDDLRTRRVVSEDPEKAARISIRAGDRAITVTGTGNPIGTASAVQVDIGEGGAVRMDANALAELLTALRDLRFLSFSDVEGEPGLTIAITRTRGEDVIEILGPCEGGRRVRSPAGQGCVEADAVAELEAVIARGRELRDRRLGVIGAESVVLSQGAVSVHGAGDDSGARRWSAQVDLLGTGDWISRDDLGTGAADGSIVATHAGGVTTRIDLYRGARGWAAARSGEAVGVLLGPTADDLLAPIPERFRTLDILARDATEISAIEIADGGRTSARYERGELIGEWTQRGGGIAIPPARLDDIALGVGTLSATRYARFLGPIRRTITIELDAPITRGERARFELDLGNRVAGGCHAAIRPDPEHAGAALAFILAGDDLCDRLLAPLAAP